MKTMHTQLTRKMQQGLTVLALAAVLLFTIVGIALAWDPTFSSSPYTGSFSVYPCVGNCQIGQANDMKWDNNGVQDMRSDDDPRLAMTADCTDDDPGEDQLNHSTAYPAITTNGVDAWIGCGRTNIPA